MLPIDDSDTDERPFEQSDDGWIVVEEVQSISFFRRYLFHEVVDVVKICSPDEIVVGEFVVCLL